MVFKLTLTEIKTISFQLNKIKCFQVVFVLAFAAVYLLNSMECASTIRERIIYNVLPPNQKESNSANAVSARNSTVNNIGQIVNDGSTSFLGQT